MDLSEFVKETLVQIVGGVKEAALALRDSTAVINPKYVNVKNSESILGVIHNERSEPVVQMIQFDVAVTVTDEVAKDKGAGLKVMNFIDVGGSKQTTTSEESVSRIKFGVPIQLPRVAMTNR